MKDLVLQLKREMAANGETPAPIRRRRKTTVSRKPRPLSYHKVAYGLTGNKIRAYTCAVLRVLKVMRTERPKISKDAVAAFFVTDGLIRYHIKKGNFETVDAVSIRLTDAGLQFFAERLSLKADIDTFEKAIRKGSECGYPLQEIEVTK